MSDPDHLLDPASPPPGPAPAEGEYLAHAARLPISIGLIVLIVAAAIYFIFRIFTYDLREFAEWLPGPMLPYLRVAASLFVVLYASLLILVVRADLSRLSWDEEGLQFTPVWGRSRRFGWEDVVSLRLPATGWARLVSERSHAVLLLKDHRQITVSPDTPGYTALVQAMTAHHKVWAAAPQRAPAEEGDESAWDSVHPPAEGRYQAPWWLLPSRLLVVLLAACLSYLLLRYYLIPSGDRPVWYPSQYQPYAWYVVASGFAFVAVEGVRQCLARTVRLVHSEPEGFWLGWYWASPRFHRWDEIASIASPSGERLGNTILALQSGERASLSPKGHGFEALLAVLERRVARIG